MRDLSNVNSLKQIHRILLTAGNPAKQPRITVGERKVARSISSNSSTGRIQNSFKQLLLDDEASIDTSDDEEALSDAETTATSECSHSNLDTNECPCQEDERSTDLLDVNGDLDLAVQGMELVQVGINESTSQSFLILLAVLDSYGKSSRNMLDQSRKSGIIDSSCSCHYECVVVSDLKPYSPDLPR